MGSHQLRLTFFRKLEVIESVSPHSRIHLRSFQQAFGRILLDDVEHAVSSLDTLSGQTHQALFDQTADDRHRLWRVTDSFERRQSPAS
jgi:hypothetical protein